MQFFYSRLTPEKNLTRLQLKQKSGDVIKCESTRIFGQRFAEESLSKSCLHQLGISTEWMSFLWRSKMAQAVLQVSFLLFSLFKVHSEIYLHNTNDGLSIESYDCVFVNSSLFYCRRPSEPIDLLRDNQSTECHLNDGRLHPFSELRSKNISMSTVLHQWRSSLERVEDYGRSLTDSSQSDGSICECLRPGSFGKNCEYRLPVGKTFEETLDWQRMMRTENPWEVQAYGDIVCYQTLQCDSGALCLDWREICDGIQHCLEGRDEENCDLLEMNECDEEKEYRCMNGMCIPEEFFLDGEFDCLDWSDEMPFKKSDYCPLESVSTECDDHLCSPNSWSCGDGQCIVDRLAFQKWASQTCQSGRDQYFMCETHLQRRQWTMSNGRCMDVGEVDGGKYEELTAVHRDEAEQCEYLLKCSLSQDAEKGCSCDQSPRCLEELREVCPSPVIRYPRRSIGSPFVFYLFDHTQHRTSKLPDFLLINGTVRCGDSLITVIEKIIPFDEYVYLQRVIEDHFCQPSRNISWPAANQSDREWCRRTNESTDRCSEWNPCLSITRLNDGWRNCLNYNDELRLTSLETERGCARVRRHRFRCSVKEATCLSVMKLGDFAFDCINQFDFTWFGSGRWIFLMNCHDRSQDDCSLLRQYIEQSWRSVSMNESDEESDHRIPFRSYCDSFGDLQSRADENLRQCQRSWICLEDQWRCQTGQCIEPNWRDDGEWDCADASDEHNLFNEMISLVLEESLGRDFTNQSYSIPSTCPQSQPFLCLSAQATRQEFSCFNLSQIGDGHIDCAGAIDERNTHPHCSQSSTLGLNFLCPSSNTCIPFRLHCFNNHRCPNRSDDEHWCDRQHQAWHCYDIEDFTCFDGKCVEGRRCDKDSNCPFGEDEYMCDYSRSSTLNLFRSREEKRAFERVKRHAVRLSPYPADANITQLDSNSISTVQSQEDLSWNLSSSSFSPYWCNRGLGVLLRNDSIVCFCPPQYYGEKCQYHADRLSVVLHLNLSQSSDSSIVLKLVVVFLLDDGVLTRDQFHLHPSFQSGKSKFHTYFLYPASFSSRQQRRERFFNRSDLLRRHPYSIRIELYQTRREEQPSLIVVWKYPVDFDHLPVSRLVKVLHLTQSSGQRDPCSSQPCQRNQRCQQLMNNKSLFICLCKTSFTGENCSMADPQCAKGYCATGSLCQANTRGSLRGDSSLPFCLCPLSRYGVRCSIKHDVCRSNPCQNGGSCLPDSQPNRMICVCTKEYSGLQCQSKRPSIDLSLSIDVPHRAAVLQYFWIDLVSFHLNLLDQQVFRALPQLVEYFHSNQETNLPNIVLVKLYSSAEGLTPNLYLLSLHLDLHLSSISGRGQVSSTNQCSHVRTFSNESSPIGYHQICIRNRTRLCFRDDVYLCICAENHSRVECFLYDDQLDRCSHCRSGGRCLQGNRRRSNDFVCVCPSCHSGDRCQFNTESLVFTLDQLFSPDLSSDRRERTTSLLILFSLFLFFLALPNNLFSFVTLRRRPCLRYGIGHYLLWMSIVNQLNLLFFVVRLLLLIVKISNTSSSSGIWDDLLCKSLNYFLSSFTRLVYWLTSLISIERLYMTIFINGQWLKKPRIARRLILLIFSIVFLTDLYEFYFYKSLSSLATGQGSTCVLEITKADRTLWLTFHLLFLLLNSLLPFLINLSSTLTIILIIVNKKIKTLNTDTRNSSSLPDRSSLMKIRRHLHLIVDVLRENKEFVIGPAITLVPQLFSLPLFISSFLFNCRNLDESWLRHYLIVSYWISLTPQWTSFFLYISPSSFYSNEWQKTTLGRRIDHLLHRHPSTPTTATLTALSAAQGTANDKH